MHFLKKPRFCHQKACSLRESKSCLEFLANIPLQSLVRERPSDGRVAWLSLGVLVFWEAFVKVRVLDECTEIFVCTFEYYESLCLLHEVTCSQKMFGGAVDSLRWHRHSRGSKYL